MPGASPLLEADGGTDYLLFRRDKIELVGNEALLKAYRFEPDSKTSRVVATCCNTGLFLDFDPGHWLTMYRRSFSGPVPVVAMRVCVASRREGIKLDDSVPNYANRSLAFMAKLIRA